MIQRYPVVVYPIDPNAPADTRGVVIEQYEGEQFRFRSMQEAEAFMELHGLVTVTMAEMAAMRAALAADDGDEDED